jgi:hypothetical protein
MAESFPYLLSATSCVFRKRMASRTGGRSLTGSEFVVVSDAGFWAASMEIPVHGEDRTLSYRGLYAALDGMAGIVNVPCFNPYRPRDINGRMASAARTGGIDGDSLFDNGGIGFTETPTMWVGSATPRRATRMLVRHPNVAGLRPGH